MKPIAVIRRDAFRLDLIEQYVVIAKEQPAAADKFIEAVGRLLAGLVRYPRSGRRWHDADPRLGPVRFRVVAGFKVLIFYVIRGDRLILLRALHGARGDIQLLLADKTDRTD